MKSYLLRLPDDLYRRVRIAAATTCQPIRVWIADACLAKLAAMPAQIAQRLLDKNPVPAPEEKKPEPSTPSTPNPRPWF